MSMLLLRVHVSAARHIAALCDKVATMAYLKSLPLVLLVALAMLPACHNRHPIPIFRWGAPAILTLPTFWEDGPAPCATEVSPVSEHAAKLVTTATARVALPAMSTALRARGQRGSSGSSHNRNTARARSGIEARVPALCVALIGKKGALLDGKQTLEVRVLLDESLNIGKVLHAF
jgi:hypothetical protein